ncbi:MAG TPA: hypothetical protein VE693_09265 [Gaiellaceae bacterium]|nr:hypothetical protein [Gaiellaceae bacterium]
MALTRVVCVLVTAPALLTACGASPTAVDTSVATAPATVPPLTERAQLFASTSQRRSHSG